VFENLRRDGRAGLVAYLTAGDPTPARTAPLVAALERGGADIIELGVPFSDPIADGPVIQRAADRALKAGTTLARVLEIASEIRQRSEIPLVLFTYLNPVLRYGFEKLAADAATAGIDGCLLTDLSVEEADQYVSVMRGKGLDTVFLAAPTSSERRLKLVARYSTGFVYLVSRTGVTGEQTSVSSSVAPLVQALRTITDLPMAVGFGVSSAAQVREICSCADAAVVGSAVVRVIEQCGDDRKLEQRLEQFTRELAEGLRR
jgi:tryptophan synthase alpha chain